MLAALALPAGLLCHVVGLHLPPGQTVRRREHRPRHQRPRQRSQAVSFPAPVGCTFLRYAPLTGMLARHRHAAHKEIPDRLVFLHNVGTS
jgi:hypothetical protein